MEALSIINLIARAVDKNGIDPDNLNTTTTDPMLIGMQRKYCKPGKCPAEWAIIDYQPTFAGNTVYGLCFLVLLAPQLWFGIRYKTWTYMTAVCLGLIGEVVGYIGRLMLSKNNFPLNNFLMLVTAPSVTISSNEQQQSCSTHNGASSVDGGDISLS